MSEMPAEGGSVYISVERTPFPFPTVELAVEENRWGRTICYLDLDPDEARQLANLLLTEAAATDPGVPA